ncbi:hypothetical protein [Rhodoblastus sp.]|uniref:hypothetical protein n=1 Tax=Rhodoblastus sp. TaxID=1962975 RepID=UPI0025F37681|nr:hypothetical protein [Rhodoblastus sp.]
MRAAAASDAMVFALPAVERDVAIVPPAAAAASLRVEIALVSPELKLPFLRPAKLGEDGLLAEDPAGGGVMAAFPKLLLVVTALPGNPDATAKLAPSHDAAGALVASFEPGHSFFGGGTVLGLGLPSASVDFDAPGGMTLRFPQVELFVDPPGVPALAMRGGSQGELKLETGGGGFTGDLAAHAAEGAQAAQRPRFVKSLAAHVNLARNSIMLLELAGKIELSAEIARWLGADIGDAPSDLDYKLALALDADWTASLKLRASGGQDFLWRSQRGQPHVPSPARDAMGAYAVFAPLLAPSLPGAGSSGYADLALSGGLAAGLAGAGFVTTQQLTILGAELVVRPVAAGGREGVVFFDVESELNLNAGLGGVSLLKSRRAIKVRQKAVGLKLAFGGDGGAPQLHPVFDPLQGFALDLSDPGTFDVPAPLGEFLQPDAARMSRDNPLLFEVDLVTKIDLGVVTIDRASVRVPLEGGGPPTLTGLGARLNLGMIDGSGHIRLLKDGVDGGFDVSLAPPLGLRVAAGLRIESHDDLLQLLVTLAVQWPIPIPLANSGLGLFGFLGLLAINSRRDQPDGVTALDWLHNAHGDPGDTKNGAAWTGKDARGDFALGLGAVLGTLEGGFLFNAKGMLMIELPGPRLLIMMKATLMLPRPPVGGDSEGLLLAVIEISKDRISLGLVLEYGIPFLLELRAPLDSEFNFNDPPNWRLDAGSVEKRNFISVRFMSSIRADGYFMVHGNGIKSPLGELGGFAVAAGIQAALTWGPEPIGLYVRVGVGADVGISFKPIMMIGRLVLEGELHLFVVSVGVKAEALLRITELSFYVKARVEGHVDFFFFEVSGGVTFELGDADLQPPQPADLIRALSLHSRSTTQLLPGQAADAQVDGSLGEALPDGAAPNFTVPIDAVPVLQFEMRAHVRPDVELLGNPVHSLLPPQEWVRRGPRLYRYEVTAISLACDKPGAAVQGGDTPIVWWDRSGNPSFSDDSAVQLALLDWIPDATPAAALRTDSRDKQIVDRWGTACAEAAPETGVLWTFLACGQGPSERGWTLTGVPYPDDPGKVRSQPAPLVMKVTEPWRTGELTDGFLEVQPAIVAVFGAGGARYLLAPKTGPELRKCVDGNKFVDALFERHPPADIRGLADAVRLDAGEVRQLRALTVADPEAGKLILRILDAGGGVMSEESPPASPMPSRWQDPAGPWWGVVQPLLNAAADMRKFFFDAELPEGAAFIEIGFSYANAQAQQEPRSYWGLLACEAVTAAEIARRDWDEDRQREKRKVIEGALTGDQSNRALLHPDAVYTVTVDYEVTAATADNKGQPIAQTIATSQGHQTFCFKTDVSPPERLEPRVMASAPAEAEEGFFYKDLVRLVFSGGEVRKLYAAYGCGLYAVVKAASGRHPPSNDRFGAGVFSFAGGAVAAVPIATLAMSPFEDSLRDALADMPCIDAANDASRHEVVTIDIPLEPSTGYVLDLEARITDAPPAPTPYPMFRRSFRTSRYADAAALAADLATRKAGHRFLANVAALTSLPAGTTPDVGFEAVLRAAGWGEFRRGGEPRTTVIWTGGAGGLAQPVAILIESAEATWRRRRVPVKQVNNGVTSYVYDMQTWLDIVEAGGQPSVSKIVQASDGARTLAILGPNARGKRVVLQLRRTQHPLYEGGGGHSLATLADIQLIAPWEGHA